jgi:UDP-2,3-diacylglucosamine pyrophosphatase LpxH
MKYRAIFISDVHIGLHASQPEHLLDFLESHTAPVIYLVGDIIDFWALRRHRRWTPAYNKLIHHLFWLAGQGTRIVYLPGNHDDFMELCYGQYGKHFEVVDETIHTTAKGLRLLVLHGHQVDYVSTHMTWLEKLGDLAYDAALWISGGISRIRRRLGLPYWSFSAWAKQIAKGATTYIEGYQGALKAEAEKYQCNGVVCGHIHTPTITKEDGFVYANCGDWVESLSALVEDETGELRMIKCS